MPDAGSRILSDGDPFERACDEFEAAWQQAIQEQSERPRIEDCLAGFASSDRAKLLRELLLLEWEYRQRREPLQLDEYTTRFEEEAAVVRAAFGEFTDSADSTIVVTQRWPEEASPSVGASSSSGSRFRILRFHKQGGLGQVWIAEDRELNREVAVKDIQPRHADSPELRSRFVTEAELTGRLEHPGIVPVYGLGQYPDGRPFYAMQFIRGNSLADAIEQFHSRPQAEADLTKRTLKLHDLLRRFVDVCHTVEYAHSRGILHRDLKPDNILLGDYGETLVVDWGLAKVPRRTTDDDSSAASTEAVAAAAGETPIFSQGLAGSLPTEAGSTMGTPPYMSPEQAAGGLNELGPSSDVYSLGATLYSILAGRAPFTGKTVGAILRQVQEGVFPRPKEVEPRVPRPLEAVCLKAMALRPEDRYHSPGELSDDVNRWLADEPVQAMRENWWQRAGRWARRNRTWVQAGTGALLLVTIVSVVAAVLIDTQRKQAEVARALAEQRLERTRRSLYAIQVAKAMSLAGTDPGRALELLTDVGTCPKDLREFTWAHCYRICRRDRLKWKAHPGAIRLAAFGKDDMTLVSVGAQGAIKVWSASTGQLQSQWQTGQKASAAALCDDRRALAIGGDDGAIQLWGLFEGKRVGTLDGEKAPAKRLAFSRDGKILASLHGGSGGHGEETSSIAVWDVPNRARLKTFDGPVEAASLAVAPDGTLVAVGGDDPSSDEGYLWVWDREQDRLLYDLPVSLTKESDQTSDASDSPPAMPTLRITCLAFQADSNTLLLGCDAGRLARFDVAGGDLSACKWPAHFGTVRSLAVHPLYPVVVSAGVGSPGRAGIYAPHRPIGFWNLEDFSRCDDLAGISDVEKVTQLAFNGTGERFVAGGNGGILTVFELREDWTSTKLDHDGLVRGAGFSPDGKRLVTVFQSGSSGPNSVRHWDPGSGVQLSLPEFEQESALWAMPGGKVFEKIGSQGRNRREEIEVVDAVSGEVLGVLPLGPEEVAVAVSLHGRLAAIQDSQQQLKIWDLQSGRLRQVLRGAASKVGAYGPVVFAPHGRLIASGSDAVAGRVALWDPLTGEKVASLQGLPRIIVALAFSPDGDTLAVGDGCAESDVNRVVPAHVTLYDVASHEVLVTLKGHTGSVFSLAFSPDGNTLATGSRDGSVRLWDVKSGVEMARLSDHKGTVFSVAFAPDGRTLATAGHDGTTILWRAATDRMVVEHQAWREASELVESLDYSTPLRSEVLTHIRANASISEAARKRALELAENLKDDPVRLNDWSWDIIWQPNCQRTEYEEALRYAQIACRLEPNNGELLNTLGAAQYRHRQYQKALQTLHRAQEFSVKTHGKQRPADLAFIAMASLQLGDRETAEATLKALETIIREPQWSGALRIQAVGREAATLVRGH